MFSSISIRIKLVSPLTFLLTLIASLWLHLAFLFIGERRSTFLKGVSNDFVNMERALGHTLKNKIQNLEMEKREVEKHIKKFFVFCKTNNFKPMLYYSGHGELPTGNWCFSDGVLGIEEILEWMPAGMTPPTIVSDACFSGTWSNFCTRKQIEGFDCLSATQMHQAAYDQGGEYKLFFNIFHIK